MEWCLGGSIVEDILRELRAELEEYLGSVNELRAGLRTTIPPKPAALYWYEMVQSTGLHLVSGGLMDQPYIWLRQWELVEGVKKLFEEISRQKNSMSGADTGIK